MDEHYYRSQVNSILTNQDQKYFLEELLDFGAQGAVYKAINRTKNQIVALKIQAFISDQELQILEYLIKKQNEFTYNIKMYEYFRRQSYICVIMEYANGGSLYKYLSNDPQITEAESLDIMRQLALGIEELHKNQIIHRDIKPENVVILNDNGRNMYKLCDIGLMKLQTPDFKDTMQVGTGTPLFQAPEMIDSMNYDEKVDVWALGVLYYELIVKQPLFQGHTDEDIYAQIRQYAGNQQLLQQHINKQNISEDQNRILQSLLQTKPGNRQKISIILLLLFPKQQSKQLIVINNRQSVTAKQVIKEQKIDPQPSQFNIRIVKALPQEEIVQTPPINNVQNELKQLKDEIRCLNDRLQEQQLILDYNQQQIENHRHCEFSECYQLMVQKDKELDEILKITKLEKSNLLLDISNKDDYISRLDLEIQQMRETHQVLIDENQNLKISNEEKEASNLVMASRENEKIQLTLNFQSLSKEYDILKDQHIQQQYYNNNLNQAITQLNGSIQVEEAKNKNLQSNVDTLNIQLEMQMRSSSIQQQQYKEKLDQLLHLNQQLSIDLGNHQQNLKRKDNMIEILNNKLDSIKSAHDSIVQENDQLKDHIENLVQQQINQLTQDYRIDDSLHQSEHCVQIEQEQENQQDQNNKQQEDVETDTENFQYISFSDLQFETLGIQDCKMLFAHMQTTIEQNKLVLMNEIQEKMQLQKQLYETNFLNQELISQISHLNLDHDKQQQKNLQIIQGYKFDLEKRDREFKEAIRKLEDKLKVNEEAHNQKIHLQNEQINSLKLKLFNQRTDQSIIGRQPADPEGAQLLQELESLKQQAIKEAQNKNQIIKDYEEIIDNYQQANAIQVQEWNSYFKIVTQEAQQVEKEKDQLIKAHRELQIENQNLKDQIKSLEYIIQMNKSVIRPKESIISRVRYSNITFIKQVVTEQDWKKSLRNNTWIYK